MKARVGLMLAVLVLDLGTKWAMYGSSVFNPGLFRFGPALTAAGIAFYALAWTGLLVCVLTTRQPVATGFALLLAGNMGQAIQFVVTGSVSDWIPVGPLGRYTLWANLADVAVTAGVVIVLAYWSKWCWAGWPKGQFFERHLAIHRQVLEAAVDVDRNAPVVRA